jgi:predicted RNA-binding Zn-ribbon protein involved in translation (DUF1610 family)
MNDNLLTDLIAFTKADVDRTGECHIPCPECGHVSSPRNPHCSFNEKGFKCFVCGFGCSLKTLAEKVGMGEREYTVKSQAPKKSQPVYHSWKGRSSLPICPPERLETMIRSWQAYKPIKRETIASAGLYVGILPESRCKHQRLIVPIFDRGLLVGLRGRSMGCDCGKWLVSAGTELDQLPLYNWEALHPGCAVWIVENCVDALLISQNTPYAGVAIYSTSYWREEWLATLQAVHPKLVIVALDNDLVGNGGAARRDEFCRDWLRSHPRLPQPSGVKLVNRLLAAGLPVTLYDWGRAEYKMDIGNLLAGARV